MGCYTGWAKVINLWTGLVGWAGFIKGVCVQPNKTGMVVKPTRNLFFRPSTLT